MRCPLAAVQSEPHKVTLRIRGPLKNEARLASVVVIHSGSRAEGALWISHSVAMGVDRCE